MYIFGGLEGITHETNDFYYFDLKEEVWNLIQLKVSNPEEIKPATDPKDPSHTTHKEENKTQLKPQSFTLYGLDNRYNKVASPMSKKHPSISRKNKSKTRNNGISILPSDREKFSKTLLDASFKKLLIPIDIPKKAKDEEVEVNSPITLGKRSRFFTSLWANQACSICLHMEGLT